MDVVTIGLWRMVAAYAFLIILLFIVRRLGVGREIDILISTLRMTLQLILMGYVLSYVLAVNHALLSAAIFVLMQAFAVNNVYARVRAPLIRRLRRAIASALFVGSTVSLIYFLVIVVGVRPWYETRYFIPIAGMLIGNSMTGVSLGAERLLEGLKARRHEVEGALVLGATPTAATRTVVRGAFTAAILPTVNSMMGMGIVFLPGLMSGQILSGVSPITAIEYQIAIMLGIMGSVALSVYILLELGHKSFFNERAQLVEE